VVDAQETRLSGTCVIALDLSLGPGSLQGGVDAACVQIGLRGRELHPEGGRINSVFVHKSETLDSYRYETKMRQNASNPISISIFSGVTPPDPHYWGSAPDPQGGEGGDGRERGGEGRERERRGMGRGGEGEVCVIAVGEIDAPG